MTGDDERREERRSTGTRGSRRRVRWTVGMQAVTKRSRGSSLSSSVVHFVSLCRHFVPLHSCLVSRNGRRLLTPYVPRSLVSRSVSHPALTTLRPARYPPRRALLRYLRWTLLSPPHSCLGSPSFTALVRPRLTTHPSPHGPPSRFFLAFGR